MTKLLDELIGNDLSAKRKALILRSFELFKKHGFQRVSIEEICRKAGVSKVTFYRYFSSKGDLILFLVKTLFDSLLQKSRIILASEMPISDKLDSISKLKQDLFREMGDEKMQSIMHHPTASNYLQETFQVSSRIFTEYLSAEQKKGVINPGVKVELIFILTQELNRLYGENRFSGLFDSPDELIRQVNELLWNGLLARG